MERSTASVTTEERDATPAAAPARTPQPASPAGGLTVGSVLALQRSAGNHALARALRPATVARLVSGQYAGLFDYDQLSDQIHTAIAGLGTDEQAIFHALERLQRDPAAITALKDAYRARHHAELLDDLRDDLSGSELAYALALLGSGGGGGAAIGSRPASDADHDAAAQRIRTAVEGLGTDEQAIFATLMAYERNSGLVAQLKLRYSALYGEDLRARLVDELTADEFANAAYLMGEAALEQTELSPAQAARVFTVMSTLTFTDTTGGQSPVPYHYPVDGCYARAQMMAQMLTRAGIASERVFATSTVPGGLHIPNQFSEDQPGGAPPETTWWYHVAPIVRVKTAAGAIEETVIDPSTQSGPVPISAWLAAMGVAPGTYSRKTHAELMAHLAAPPPGPMMGTFPAGEQIVYTTDRNTMFPGEGPHADSADADAQLEALNPRMTGYAALAATHEIAAAVRTELARPGCTAADVIAAIRKGAPAARAVLWTQFAILRSEVVARFPGDAAAIDAAVGP